MLPNKVEEFIRIRIEKGDVLAVILYGSYARGTQNEKSDVDLIFIIKEGFASTCIKHHGYFLEILETTKENIFSHWKYNFDQDRHYYLWKDAKILFEIDESGLEVLRHAKSLFGTKKPFNIEDITRHRELMLMRLDKIGYLGKSDIGSASIMLFDFTKAIIDKWYKVKGYFRPPSKEFISEIGEKDSKLSEMIFTFYVSSLEFGERIEQVRKMVERIYS